MNLAVFMSFQKIFNGTNSLLSSKKKGQTTSFDLSFLLLYQRL